MPPASLSLQPPCPEGTLLPTKTLRVEFSQVLGSFQGDAAPWDELDVHEQPSRISPSAQTEGI